MLIENTKVTVATEQCKNIYQEVKHKTERHVDSIFTKNTVKNNNTLLIGKIKFFRYKPLLYLMV